MENGERKTENDLSLNSLPSTRGVAEGRGVSHPQTNHLYYCPLTPSPLGEGWPKAGVCRTAAKQRTERAAAGCVPLSNHPYPPIVP